MSEKNKELRDIKNNVLLELNLREGLENILRAKTGGLNCFR